MRSEGFQDKKDMKSPNRERVLENEECERRSVLSPPGSFSDYDRERRTQAHIQIWRTHLLLCQSVHS